MRSFAALLMTLMLVFLTVQPAYACSAGPDFDPVTNADVIVAGRLTQWQRRPNASAAPGFTAIQVAMDIDQIFKGSLSRPFQFLDAASLGAGNGEWAGGSGACGSFDADPTGQYAILGLSKDATGAYTANRLLVFYIGSEPKGAAYEQALARLRSLPPNVLPNTGISGTTVDSRSPMTSQLIGLGSILLLGGILLRRPHLSRWLK